MAKFEFEYGVFNHISELNTIEQKLVNAAIDAAANLSYAPYSHFKVGAAILLSNLEIISGGNQENAAYPASICAERVALSTASSLFPNEKIISIAIAYQKEQVKEAMQAQILSPCGICRQSIAESASKQNSKIQLLLTSANHKIFKIDDANHLLPMDFGSDML